MFGGLEIKGESSEKNKQVEQDPPTKPPYPVGHNTSPHEDKNDDDGPHAATAATATTVPVTTSVQSGFSFLSSSRTSSSSSAVNAVAAPPAASVSSSAFGFLSVSAAAAAAADPSSTDVKHKEEDHDDEPVKGKEEMEEGVMNGKETKEGPMGDSKDFKVKAEDSILSSVLRSSEPTVSSGFSFLSATTTTTAAAASDAAEGQDLKPTSTAPAKNVEDEKSSTSHSNSMFSMLQVKTNKDTSSTTKDPPIMSQSNSSYNDILSLSTPSQPMSSASSSAAAAASTSTSEPTGSGIVFGGAAAKPKTMVKKRSRTKKIGAAAAGFGSAVTLTTSGNGSMGVTTTTTTSNGNVEDGTMMESVPIKDKEDGDSNKNEEDVRAALAHEANEAISRAEEFLSSKQSLSSSSNVPMSFSTGRYSDMKNSVEEDYGEEVSSSTVGEYGIRKDGEYHGSDGKRGHNSHEMDDYQRAKAAAQEAMKKDAGASGFSLSSSSVLPSSSSSSRRIGFGGGISGFFKRNLGGANEKKQEDNAPSFGQSMNISRRGMKGVQDASGVEYHGRSKEYHEHEGRQENGKSYRDKEYEDDENEEGANAETTRYYLEKVEHEKRQMEVERQERLRQEELDRKIAEEARLQEERRQEEERIRAEEERKQREAEEAANRTPERLLQRLLEEFASKSQSATLAVSKLRQERATMLEKRAAAEKHSRMALQQIAQAEKQQMEAAEQEDFELADRLAAVIDQHQREKEELAQVLEKFEGIIEDLDYKRLDVVKRVWLCFIGVQKELQDFLVQQEKSDITDDTEIWRKFEDDTKKLAAENERLMSYLKNIERDEGFAKEERQELEATIHEQTSGIEELRDTATQKLNVINAEIDELRRQLEAKEMEAAQVKLELHEHEDSIEQIRSKFSRQLHRLEKKETAVRESRKEWETEELIYKKARENLEAEVTAHSEAIVAHDKIIAQVKDEILVAEELAKIIAQEVMVERGSDKDCVDKDLAKIQSEVLELEAAAEEANEVLEAATAFITSLKDEIASIDDRLPILESEKKSSAANRDFKAAAKASKEIKELTARKSKCEEDLQVEALERQESAKKLVNGCLQKLEEKKSIAHEKEKETGVKRMVDLVKKIINLEKLREEVCGTDEEPLQNVKSVGGFVLDSEISALMMEGEELDKRFGGWNDIMLEYASKESEDEKPTKENEEETLEVEVEAKDNEQNTSHDDEGANLTVGNERKDAEISNDGSKDNTSKDDIVAKFKDMHKQLLDLELKLENAIETEEYEVAAEIDDQIAMIKTMIESLDLSEDERNRVLSDAPDTNDDNLEKNEGTSSSPEETSDKELGHDEECIDKRSTNNSENSDNVEGNSVQSNDSHDNGLHIDDHNDTHATNNSDMERVDDDNIAMDDDSTPLPESKTAAGEENQGELSDVEL